MSPTRRYPISRWRRRSVTVLALLLAWPALGHAATAEEALTKAIRGIQAPGEVIWQSGDLAIWQSGAPSCRSLPDAISSRVAQLPDCPVAT